MNYGWNCGTNCGRIYAKKRGDFKIIVIFHIINEKELLGFDVYHILRQNSFEAELKYTHELIAMQNL